MKDDVMISTEEAAGYIGVDKRSLYLTAKYNPERLPFPCFFIGTRLKIPRKPFMDYLGISDK